MIVATVVKRWGRIARIHVKGHADQGCERRRLQVCASTSILRRILLARIDHPYKAIHGEFDVKIPKGVDASFAVEGLEQLANISPENVQIRRAWVIPRAWLPKDWAPR